MAESSILGQVALGYSPIVDKNRAIIATRLGVFPLNSETRLDVAGLLSAIAEVWPADGPKVFLNLASEALLIELLGAKPPKNLSVEVPAFMAGEATLVAALGSTTLVQAYSGVLQSVAGVTGSLSAGIGGGSGGTGGAGSGGGAGGAGGAGGPSSLNSIVQRLNNAANDE